MNARAIPSRPDPVKGYEKAVKEQALLDSGGEGELNPRCAPVFLTHGRRTERVVLWFHGYTNCPLQFERLAQRCFAEGWNAWVPRAPFHGLADRMTSKTSLVTADMLARFADRAVDIACGLGERVIVGGLSMGGTLSAWLGQNRADIDLALPIAPVISPMPGPLLLARLLSFALRTLPDRLVWWDRARRESLEGPPHAYFRYSTKGVGEIMALGQAFAGRAGKSAPAARRFRFVLNESDEAVSNAPAERILEGWRRRGAANVGETRFPREMGFRHDLIEPAQPYQRVDEVYPLLLELIRGETS